MSVPPALAVAAPPSWSPPVAEQTLITLQQARREVTETMRQLRRAGAHVQKEWRGPARDDFDTRFLHVVADLRALEAALTRSAQLLSQQITWVSVHAAHVPTANKDAFGMTPLFGTGAP